MSDELEVAAERLRRYLEIGGEFEDGNEPFDEYSDERWHWRDNHAQSDLWELANAYLAANPPDEPLTEEWLRANGFSDEEDEFFFQRGPIVLTRSSKGSWQMLFDDGFFEIVNTRQTVINLLAALQPQGD